MVEEMLELRESLRELRSEVADLRSLQEEMAEVALTTRADLEWLEVGLLASKSREKHAARNLRAIAEWSADPSEPLKDYWQATLEARQDEDHLGPIDARPGTYMNNHKQFDKAYSEVESMWPEEPGCANCEGNCRSGAV